MSVDGSRTTDSEAGAIVDAVIGFDFGTASTKVVIRLPYFGGGVAFAVPFGRLGFESNQYLRPSRVSFVHGRATLDDRAGGEVARNIKARWLTALDGSARPSTHGPSHPESAAVAFLALTLQHARKWLTDTQRLVQGRRIRWTLHLGMPAETYADAPLRESLKGVARAAWALSVPGVNVDIRDANAMLTDANIAPAMPELADLDVLPEVAAEVVGYALSDLRRPGLHFLVDIGASTLDVCGFVLHEDDEGQQYNIMTASVGFRGTSPLQQARFDALHGMADTLDPLIPVPGEFFEWLRDQELERGTIARAEARFRKNCANQVAGVIITVKQSRDPLSPAWSDGVPMFFCGGGSLVPLFKESIREVDKRLKKVWTKWPGFNIMSLGKPGPEHLVADVDASRFHRLAVAWGLSFDDDEFGLVRDGSTIDDVHVQPRRAVVREYIDKDQV